MGPCEILPLWEFCSAPKSLVYFRGMGGAQFSESGIPSKQPFQRWVLGSGAWITATRLRIWA